MRSIEAAVEAQHEMNGKKIFGDNEIRVHFKKSKSELNPEANIFLRNLGTQSNKELQDEMEKYGTVVSSKIK